MLTKLLQKMPVYFPRQASLKRARAAGRDLCSRAIPQTERPTAHLADVGGVLPVNDTQSPRPNGPGLGAARILLEPRAAALLAAGPRRASSVALEALARTGKLYNLEIEVGDRSAEERRSAPYDQP